MMGWIAAGINLFAVMFYLFAAFSLTEHTRRIQEMTSLVGPSSKNQFANAYTTYNARIPPMGGLYGHDAYNSQSMNRHSNKNDAADEFFVADAGRNQAYDFAADYNKIVNEDRPGEDEEINEQIRPVQKLDQEKESWYKEYKKNENDRKNDRRPASAYGNRYRDRYRDRSVDQSRDYREDRISHPYGYGHQQRGRYRDFY